MSYEMPKIKITQEVLADYYCEENAYCFLNCDVNCITKSMDFMDFYMTNHICSCGRSMAPIYLILLFPFKDFLPKDYKMKCCRCFTPE